MNTEDHRKAVAAEVRAEAARAEMSQAALARKAGVAPQTLSAKLRAERSFTVEELLAIAQALDLDPATLLPRYLHQESAA